MLRITRKLKNWFTDEQEFDEGEYKNQLLNAHKENKAFNDKVISTTSIAAVPLLINLSEKLYFNNCLIYWLFLVSLILFVGIFLFQIINNILATKGCDKGLEKNYSISNWFFDKTDKIEIGIYIFFFIALLLSLIMFIINLNISINDKKSSAKYNIKEERTIEMTKHKNLRIINETHTPHKTQRPSEEKKSQTPHQIQRPQQSQQEKKGK